MHVILSCLALLVGAMAASSGASGFWTGCFVGAILATSGVTWAKAKLSELAKAHAARETQLAMREAALQKSVERFNQEQAQKAQQQAVPVPSQVQAAPVVVPPPPPPPSQPKVEAPLGSVPKVGPGPLPETAFKPALQWPVLGDANLAPPQ